MAEETKNETKKETKKETINENVVENIKEEFFDFGDIDEINNILSNYDEDDNPFLNDEDESLDEIIEKTIDALKEQNIVFSNKNELKDFLTFKYNVKEARTEKDKDTNGSLSTYYNLLVRAEDILNAKTFVRLVVKALGVSDGSVCTIHEIDKADKDVLVEQSRHAKYDVIIIDECIKKPVIDSELPSSSARDANQKDHDRYIKRWKNVVNFVKENPTITIIVIANDEYFDQSFRENNELYYRIFGHHINVYKTPESVVYDACLRELKKASIPYSKDFEAAFSEYFYAIYRTADLQGNEFVIDMRNRLFTNYYKKKDRENKEISVDCIPPYHKVQSTPEEVLKRLDDMTGLETVKQKFRDMYSDILLERQEQKNSRKREKKSYHMLFTGNPGTGKTTVAERTADLFYAMGLISKPKVVTCKPEDFVSQWRGGDREKANLIFEDAYGGVLFIDEAYSFNSDDEKLKRALTMIVKEMVSNSDKLIVIMAGYKEEMEGLFKVNTGLKSRFRIHFEFEDYSDAQLKDIFLSICKKKEFTIDKNCNYILDDAIMFLKGQQHFGNAREMENLFNDLKEVWASARYNKQVEMKKQGVEEFVYPNVFTKEHFNKVIPERGEIHVDSLIGLTEVKKQIQDFRQQVLYRQTLKEKGMTKVPVAPMHMLFTGNPGTGKTTVAQYIADDLYSVGVLKSNRIQVKERKDLVAGHLGQTAIKTNEVIKSAVGGVLFIDEAYSLARDEFGHECIETLLTAMLDHKDDTIFIFAGYTKEMQYFVDQNPGIQSRIGRQFHFKDYTPEELTEIFKVKMNDAGFKVNAAAIKKVKKVMQYFHSAENFGNGRFVDHVIEKTLTNRAHRDYTTNYRDITTADIPEINALIGSIPGTTGMHDPKKVTQDNKYRTAYHELGHAISIYLLNGIIPDSISTVDEAGSLGRVRFTSALETEEDYKNFLVTGMAGRAAEIVILGSATTGCRGDFERCKDIAHRMIREYAMGELGVTKPMDLVVEADQRARQIVEENKDFMLYLAKKLVDGEEFTGKEFVKEYKNFKKAKAGTKEEKEENGQTKKAPAKKPLAKKTNRTKRI